MGCFLSSNKATPSPNSAKTRRPLPPLSPLLPPHPVEETVKEVLSETPKSKPIYQNTLKEDPKKMVDKESVFQEKRDAHHFKKTPKKIADNRDEVSEISEIYSILNKSISASTERRENEEGQQMVVLRSPEKFKRRSVSGDFTAKKVKSPVTRPDPSPNRARIVPGRERRGVVADAGESSRRRSRSPAIQNDGGATRQSLGRTPSLRKTGRSPGRVRSDLAEKSRRNTAPTSNELLENPLVSLECFIFL